jgi:hypothetical protein
MEALAFRRQQTEERYTGEMKILKYHSVAYT